MLAGGSSVHVFELTWPGGFLQGLPDDEVMAVEALLRKLEGALAGAAVGLCLFEEQMVTFRDRMREEFAEHLEYMDAVSELAARYRREPSPNRSIDKYGRVLDDSHDRASRDLARARWEAGNWPKAYIWRLPEIHARTVIYSLDEIGKTIAALAAMPNMPEGVTEAKAAFEREFPALVALRNSAHHEEDRIRGMAGPAGGKKRPIVPQPITSASIEAPGGGLLVLGNVANDQYGATTADGSFKELGINRATVEAAQQIIQKVLNSFSWKGSPSRSPAW
jgi:hypothetical protein